MFSIVSLLSSLWLLTAGEPAAPASQLPDSLTSLRLRQSEITERLSRPMLELKSGVVEGTYYDAAGIAQIATIPGREILLGRLLGSMNSPIANLARVLKQIAEKDGAPAEA